MDILRITPSVKTMILLVRDYVDAYIVAPDTTDEQAIEAAMEILLLNEVVSIRYMRAGQLAERLRRIAENVEHEEAGAFKWYNEARSTQLRDMAARVAALDALAEPS